MKEALKRLLGKRARLSAADLVLRPPLPLPRGRTRDEVLASLVSISIDGSRSGELAGYATADCDRFLYTVDLVPQDARSVLEIGANPYFTTILLQRERPELAFTLVNYFGGETAHARQSVSIESYGGHGRESFEFDFLNHNLETGRLPLSDASFDCVLYCEVLEHLTSDPVHALSEIRRVLKPDGRLVLTTPNVARLENVARLLSGANIYDPYSGYGPYGRHNREYNRHELHQLLTYCGFEPEVLFTADVHDNVAAAYFDVSGIPLPKVRRADLGQYLFSRWTRAETAGSRRPSWLYRSYPADQIE